MSEISAAPGKKLYIVAGPRGGNGSIGRKEKIAVPAKTWKVIVVLNRQGLGIQGITPDTQGDHRDDAQLGQRQGQGVEKLPEYL